MNDARRDSSVLVSLAELRDIERERVEAEIEAERSAAEAAEAEARARRQADARARKEAEENQRAEERARKEQQQRVEAEERAARIERERRSRVEAELALAQARVEAARSARERGGSSGKLIAAIVATVLVLGSAMGLVVYQQTRRSAALAAKLEASSARSGDTLSDLQQKNSLSRQRISKLQSQLAALARQTKAAEAAKSSPIAKAAAASKPHGRTRSRTRPRGKGKGSAPLLRTRCPDNDPLCGIESSRKLFAR